MGDSPLVGAGTWADDATAAISCTGDGEAIIRNALAHEIDALMRHAGLPLDEACERALAGLAPFGTGGLIAVGAGGGVARRSPPPGCRAAGAWGRDRRCGGARWLILTTTSTGSRSRSSPARDAAARELKRAGDRETAARVAKLPKPTPAAWTANQVAREQPELIEALLEAGAALREAQEAAVSGHGARGLREATLAERGAVDAVMAAATAHSPAGRPLSRAMADRLRTTLNAAAGDEALRAALANGRLVSEAQAGGAWPFALEPGGDERRRGRSRETRATAGGGEGPRPRSASRARRRRAARRTRAKSSAQRTARRRAGGEKAAAKPRRAARCGAAAKARPPQERAERKAAERAEPRRRRAGARGSRAAGGAQALESQLRDAAQRAARSAQRIATAAAEVADDTTRRGGRADLQGSRSQAGRRGRARRRRVRAARAGRGAGTSSTGPATTSRELEEQLD